MFPYRDHNPSRRTPYITWGLIAINVLIFVAGLSSNPGPIYYEYGLIPANIRQGEGFADFLSTMFIHGGFGHLFGNMLFLWIFGDNVEDALGHLAFAAFYLVSGVAASLAHVAFNLGSEVPLIGASGAIAGVMGAYALLYPRARVDVLVILVIYIRSFAIPAFIVLGVWLGIQSFSSLAMPSGGGGVAYLAHIGGFVAGLVIILPVWIARGGRRFWDKSDAHPPHAPSHAREWGRVPRISRRR